MALAMRTLDYFFAEFDGTEFFYPRAGMVVGALWGYPVLTTSLGQTFRRFVRAYYWFSIVAIVASLVLASWLHSLAVFVVLGLLLEVVRFLLLRPLLQSTPRLPAHLSLHVYAQHLGAYQLMSQEIVCLFLSAMSFLVAAMGVSPFVNVFAGMFALYLCVNSILACLARRQLTSEESAS
jgi:hypothetical protein